jgi:hypothetical protein
MEKNSQAANNVETKEKSEAKTALLLAIIFGGLVVIMIAGMLAFDIYAEKHSGGSYSAPADAADR